MAVFVVVPSGLEAEAGIARERHALATWSIGLVSAGHLLSGSGASIYECAHPYVAPLSLCVALRIGCHVTGWFHWDTMGLLLFFTGFTALEAMLPSLATIYAPAASRGTAMGVFASSQFIGVFFGGILGGALLDQAGVMGVWLGMSALTLVWALVLGVSHLASPDSVEVA